MTGAHQQRREIGAGRRTRLVALLWFVAALSVLQWSAPTVDASLFVRKGVGAAHAVGLLKGDWPAAAVEAIPASGTLAVDKRSHGWRSLPVGEDFDATVAAASSPAATLKVSEATTAPTDGATARDGHTFTARSPPGDRMLVGRT